MENTQEKLKRIICEYVDVNMEQIDINMDLKFDIGLDSFGLISLICAIESEFNVHIPDAMCAKFNTLLDMVTFIDEESKKKLFITA